MDLNDAAQAWEADGFVILPAFIPADGLSAAVNELDLLFPSAAGFHDGADPRAGRFIGDEFAGIDTFPFAGTAISLLAVHHRILDLAELLLGDGDIHIYSAEAWAKYTGACDHDQDLHRDYLNHTLLVPSTAAGCRQLEMFVFLSDVPEELGPPHLVSREHTADLPAMPNWFRRPGREGTGRFIDDSGSPELYAAEVSGAGPAGTVIAFETGTLHRGTRLTAPRGARYSMHLGFRPSSLRWGAANRMGRAELRTSMGRLRPPRHTTTAPSLRIPTAWAPLLDPRDTDRDGTPVSRAQPHAMVHGRFCPAH